MWVNFNGSQIFKNLSLFSFFQGNKKPYFLIIDNQNLCGSIEFFGYMFSNALSPSMNQSQYSWHHGRVANIIRTIDLPVAGETLQGNQELPSWLPQTTFDWFSSLLQRELRLCPTGSITGGRQKIWIRRRKAPWNVPWAINKVGNSLSSHLSLQSQFWCWVSYFQCCIYLRLSTGKGSCFWWKIFWEKHQRIYYWI